MHRQTHASPRCDTLAPVPPRARREHRRSLEIELTGSIDIRPTLNEDEQAYLSAFTSSRRYRRAGGPYDVPGNPAAEREAGRNPAGHYHDTADGQPSLVCPWTVCWDGCCLSLDPERGIHRAGDWMRYLIDHFLRPGALARGSGLHRFRPFTFDHRLDGLVTARRPGADDVLMVLVTDNAVYDETTSAADPRLRDEDPD